MLSKIKTFRLKRLFGFKQYKNNKRTNNAILREAILSINYLIFRLFNCCPAKKSREIHSLSGLFKKEKFEIKNGMKIYLDSNVLISVLLDELGRNYRQLAEEATTFFKRAKEKNATIIVSEFFIQEIEDKIGIDKKSIFEYFELIETEIEFVDTIKDDVAKAKEIERIGIHSGDSEHIAVAIRAKADCIVTFNIKDFEKAKTLIEVKEPLEFK